MAQEVSFPKQDPESVSPLNLAFIGDSVYELYIRNRSLIDHNGSVKDANNRTAVYTNASAQSRMIQMIIDDLSPSEIAVYKRGRNAKSLSAPKSCTISEYRKATGFEAMIGYLFLKGDYHRITQIMEIAIERFNADRKQDHE